MESSQVGDQTRARRHNRATLSFRERDGVALQHVRSLGRSFVPHLHEEFQIVVCVAGGLDLFTAGARHRLGASWVSALSPGQVHAGEPVGWGWECRNFYVSAERMGAIAERLGLAKLSFRAPALPAPSLAAVLAHAHVLASEPEDNWTELDAALEALLVLFAAPEETEGVVAAKPILRAQALLREHFATGVSLEDLARVAGISKFHFLRQFTRMVGITPHAFQNQLRLAYALRRLRDGASVAEAASEAGYSDQSHLTRVLQRTHGLTPGLVRRAD